MVLRVAKVKRIALLLLITFVPVSPTLAETTECTVITSVPIIISKQGVYCFKQNIGTNISTGAAIEIQTNNVTIDFNGFKLGGLAAGLGTSAYGVNATDRLNITLRNGNIRGFSAGIYLVGASGGGHVVEESQLDGNTWVGIWTDGNGNLLRGNRVIATGGSNVLEDAYGIVSSGSGGSILNNEIYGTFDEAFENAFGVYVVSDGTVLQGNRVKQTESGSGSTYGIYSAGNDNVFDNNAIINSVEIGTFGINDNETTSGYCTNNTVLGYTTQNGGCTDGGGNSFSP